MNFKMSTGICKQHAHRIERVSTGIDMVTSRIAVLFSQACPGDVPVNVRKIKNSQKKKRKITTNGKKNVCQATDSNVLCSIPRHKQIVIRLNNVRIFEWAKLFTSFHLAS